MAIQNIDNPKAWLADPRNIEEQRELLEHARTRLLTDHLCLGGDIVRLDLIIDPTVKTACTNGERIKFNPLFSASISGSDRGFVFAHEVVHVGLSHPLRISALAKTQRDLEIANIAFDAVVNRTLVAAGLTLPDGAVWLPQYNDLCEEEIFAILKKAGNIGDQPGDDEGEGETLGWGKSDSEENEEGDDADQPNPGEDEGSGDEESEGEGEGSGDEGSESYELPDVSEWGEVEELTNEDGSPLTLDQANEKLTEQALNNATTQRVGKLIGNTGSAYAQALDEATRRAGYDWKDDLAEFVEANAAGDPRESWERVDRRFIGDDEYLPGTETEGLGAVYILADESGSVSDDEFQLAWEHVKKIHAEVEPERLVLIRFDHEVQGEPEVFEPGDDLGELHRRGSGGTLIKPPLKWIADNAEENPSCVIVLTDLGIFDWHDATPPDCPVIWADCSGYWHDAAKVPFGRKILVTQ